MLRNSPLSFQLLYLALYILNFKIMLLCCEKKFQAFNQTQIYRIFTSRLYILKVGTIIWAWTMFRLVLKRPFNFFKICNKAIFLNNLLYKRLLNENKQRKQKHLYICLQAANPQSLAASPHPQIHSRYLHNHWLFPLFFQKITY